MLAKIKTFLLKGWLIEAIFLTCLSITITLTVTYVADSVYKVSIGSPTFKTGNLTMVNPNGSSSSSTNNTSNSSANGSSQNSTGGNTSNSSATTPSNASGNTQNPSACPAGQTGTPPNCVTTTSPGCPTGKTGTPPNCVTPPPATCPPGKTGTPPNCVTPPPATCPPGQTGTPPNCVTPPPAPTGCFVTVNGYLYNMQSTVNISVVDQTSGKSHKHTTSSYKCGTFSAPTNMTSVYLSKHAGLGCWQRIAPYIYTPPAPMDPTC